MRVQRGAIMQNAKRYEERAVNAIRLQASVKMSERRILIGINVSILVILTIFALLLFLPSRLLLNTNYYSKNETINENTTIQTTENVTVEAIVIPVDHRKLRRCPRFKYEDRLISVFQSYYDRNCTYTLVGAIDDTEEEINEEFESEPFDEENNEMCKEIVNVNPTEKVEKSEKDRHLKSMLLAEHILVTMLLISIITALIEAMRINLAREQAEDINSRKTSMVKLPTQKRFKPRYPMTSTSSLEMNRSALRLIGARSPSLIRRSSFPTQPSKQSSGSVSGTPNNGKSRRQSAESNEEIELLMNTLYHRARLIRRH